MTAKGRRLFRSEVMARYAEELASIRASGETHPQGISMAMNEARRWLDRELDLALPDPEPTERTAPILEDIDVLKLELQAPAKEADARHGTDVTNMTDEEYLRTAFG
jgi:hypothetical protein